MATRSGQTSWLRLSDGEDFNGTLSHLPVHGTRCPRGESQVDMQREGSCRNFSRRFPTQNLWNSMEEYELLRMEREFYDALGQGNRRGSEQDHRIDRDLDQNPVVEVLDPVDHSREGLTNTHRNQTFSMHQEHHADHELVPTDIGCNESVHQIPQPETTRLRYSVWLPFLVVLIPNVAFASVLLAIVYTDKWKFSTDTFSPEHISNGNYPGYILVRMSPTRIAIITSCSATLAPFLTVAIMSLWKFRTVRYYAQRGPGAGPDNHVDVHHIPQVNLLLSLLGGGLSGLGKYVKTCWPRGLSRRRTTEIVATTRPVHLTAMVLLLCIVLVLSTWTADTVFHSLSDTVSVPEYTTSTSMNSFGRQLADYCQNFDRSKNFCLPCSWNVHGPTSEYWERTNNWYRLRMNISEDVQVRAIEPDLSILLPPSQRVPNTTDYRATTLGVSAQCRPITDKCNPRYPDNTSVLTVFNCSEQFRGVNGQAPVIPMNVSFTTLDPDTPPLVVKRSAYLQFGFFLSEDLSTAYNPVNYNVSSPSWALRFGLSTDGPCPTDDELLTTVHMGVAGRFGLLSSQAGLDLSQDMGLFFVDTTFDFMFECDFSAYDVEYTWARGDVRSYTLSLANSSLLTMYVGAMQYYTQSAQDEAYSDVNTMAVQGNSTAMAETWARLFSARMLSLIGAYTDSRVNLAEQERKNVFVARVHIGSLIFIVSCGAAYVILICTLAISALLCLHHDPRLRACVDDLSFEKQLKNHIAAAQQQQPTDPSSVSSGQTTAVDSSPRSRSRTERHLRSASHGNSSSSSSNSARAHTQAQVAPEIILTPPPPPPGFF